MRIRAWGRVERRDGRERGVALVVWEREAPDDRQLSFTFEVRAGFGPSNTPARPALRPVARVLPRVIEAEVVKSAARAA